MKFRPILFNGEMVRAILDGRKTQTRRVVKPQPIGTDGPYERGMAPGIGSTRGEFAFRGSGKWEILNSPFGKPGDRLLVASTIPGVPKTYCAGSDGLIYSRARGEWRPLKQWHNQKGYSVVTISDGPKKTSKHIHSLVCSSFYGAKPSSAHQVRHLNGNPSDGRPENLCWGTQEENWADRKIHGNGIEGEKHHFAKLTDVERSHLRWALEKGLCSQRQAARALGMSQSAIGPITAGAELYPATFIDPGPRVPIITLEITGVRVERLQDITTEDAEAEGVYPLEGDYSPDFPRRIAAFRRLWESISGEGSWIVNPWVWVIEFKKVEDK